MRIAIVNDLSLAVEILRRVIAAMPRHQLAWVAVNGAEAVARCKADRPDLILMDLIMPVMDGVDATRRIMAETPCAILVVTASLAGNLNKVFEALSAGALDAVCTPVAGPGGSLDGSQDLQNKIQSLSRLVLGTPFIKNAAAAFHTASASGSRGLQKPMQKPPLFTAIGASTGGPHALSVVLGGLPHDFPAAVIVVQHLDAAFAPGFIQWLGFRSKMPVHPAETGVRPQTGHVYVACQNDHLIVTEQATFAYLKEPLDNPYRPSVDECFQSLAANAGPAGVAVLLTGMGSDGANGLLKLRRLGWLTLAQDQATSIIFGMPKAAADTGAAMHVLPLNRIAGTILPHIMSIGAST